jgi:hypothetical protein
MSFIIIGFGRQIRKDFGTKGHTQQCVRCTNSVFYHLVHTKTYFTFFFVPIFSYRSEYRVECPICHHGVELQGEEIEAAKHGTLKVYVSDDPV